jgi:citrate synthase
MEQQKAKLIIGTRLRTSRPAGGGKLKRPSISPSLRQQSGYITFDPGLANTGTCLSSITFLDGENGILRYRGIPIEQLAENASFLETAYLLIYGHLPNQTELSRFQHVHLNSMIHEDMKNFFNAYPAGAHPMCILSAVVNSLSAYYPEFQDPEPTREEIDMIAVELMSKVRTISAFSYKKSIGEPFIYPRGDLRYVHNFLHMMFSSPIRDYELDEDIVEALQVLLILHADHEQNCSTSTVRLVSSSKANLFASVSAGISALWGRLHGEPTSRSSRCCR